MSRAPSPAPAVLCLGLTALDQVWRMDRLFTGGSQKIPATAQDTVCGGMAATAAVTVARLGGRAAFLGRAGADAAGRIMADALAAEGVDISALRRFDGHRSSVSAVLVDERGERQITNYPGDCPTDPRWLPLDRVRTVGAVLADPRWPEGAAALFGAARAAGVPTVLDADISAAPVFELLLPLTDHALFSESGLAAFAGAEPEAALEKVASYGCAISGVTLGEAGVLWRTAGRLERMPAPRVPVVDTTGAGDVFHGAYAYALAAGEPVDRAMSFAVAAAALKCTRPGGRDGIPTLHDCLNLQRTFA